MNALEDTRELVTVQDGLPIAAATDRRQLARSIAGLIDDLIYQWPDVEIASIRITEQPFIGPTSNALFREFTVTGRRGPLTPDECPSCHTTAGHPHTDYCNLTKPLAGNIQVRDPQPRWQVLSTNAIGDHNQPWADDPCPTEWTAGTDQPWHRCARPAPHHPATPHLCWCGDHCELVLGGLILDEIPGLLADRPDSP